MFTTRWRRAVGVKWTWPTVRAGEVQHHLDALASNGVDAPAFDEAMHQYGILLLYGYFIRITICGRFD